MFVNSKLTDEEVERKFSIDRNDRYFQTARDLADFRPDRCICDWPEIMCPHCCERFALRDKRGFSYVLGAGDSIVCVHCERLMYVEHVERRLVTLLNVNPQELG